MDLNTKTSLQDFFELVRGGEVSADDFFAGALCYRELRDYFNQYPDVVDRLFDAAPESQKIIIGEIVATVQSSMRPKNSEGAHQFDPNNKFPDVSSPGEVAKIAELTSNTLKKPGGKDKRVFVSELVTSYANALRQEQRDAARQVFLESFTRPIPTKDPVKVKSIYIEEIKKRIKERGAPEELIELADAFLEQTHLHEIVAADVDRAQKIVQTITEHVDDPPVFAENFLHKVNKTEVVSPAAVNDVINNAVRYAQIATVVNTKTSPESFTLGVFVADPTKITPEIEKEAERLVFLEAWEPVRRVLNSPEGIEKITEMVGANVVSSELFNSLRRTGERLAAGPQIKTSTTAAAESLIGEIFKSRPDLVVPIPETAPSEAAQPAAATGQPLPPPPGLGMPGQPGSPGATKKAPAIIQLLLTKQPSQDLIHYLETAYSSGVIVVNVRQFFEARIVAEYPAMFHFEFVPPVAGSTSPLEWVLRVGKKEVAAGAVAQGAVEAGYQGLKNKWAGRVAGFLAKVGLSEAAAATLGGIVGAIIAAVPWVIQLAGKGLNRVGEIFLLGSANVGRAIVDFARGLNLPAAPQSLVDKHMVLIIVFLAVGLPLFLAQSRLNGTMGSFPTSMGSSGSGYTGPIQYTGPQFTGDLQCLNYNVAQKVFTDQQTGNSVSAGPMTSAQGDTLNAALSLYPQLGLYNCILNCPQYKAGLYADGASGWWGWTPESASIVIYDGFFASSDTHLQARLIAHELAHEVAANHNDIESAFLNGTTTSPKGTCGCLGTYPSRDSHPGQACDSRETPDETFAEAAAMFLTGENLQSLCPSAYTFMNNLFGQCAQ
jgi:hypothetical protein